MNFEAIALARPRRWMKDLRFGGASKHITKLQAEMSVPSSQTLVQMMRFLRPLRRLSTADGS